MNEEEKLVEVPEAWLEGLLVRVKDVEDNLDKLSRKDLQVAVRIATSSLLGYATSAKYLLADKKE